jgi:hypothetical protein
MSLRSQALPPESRRFPVGLFALRGRYKEIAISFNSQYLVHAIVDRDEIAEVVVRRRLKRTG